MIKPGTLRVPPLLRSVAVACTMIGGLVVFARVVHGHYPVQQWLFWHYLEAWLLAGGWLIACLSMGHRLLGWILPRPLRIREHLSLGLSIGVFAFYLAFSLLGFARAWGTVVFVLLPIAFLAAGARPLWRYGRRLVRHLQYRRRRYPTAQPWWSWPVLAAGVLGCAILYLLILTPENVAFDSRWYHLPIAEHYVAAGGIVRFPEGWFLGAYPQLATILYSWAFLTPMSSLFDRVEIAAHMEFVLFLATLAAIPALVRRLVRGSRARHAWVALFLFPGIFVYDSTLCLGADHVAALFAIPIYLSFLLAWRTLDPRACLLLGICLSGALDTKYTAASLVAFPVLALGIRAIWLQIRRLRDKATPLPWAGVGALAATGLLLTAPHWLRNFVFYSDPLYPMLNKHLSVRPWTAAGQAAYLYDNPGSWHPARNLDGLLETFRALFTWSFVPNNWDGMHGHVPVIGSLFTLCLACLPFLKRSGRVWGVFLAGHLGVFVWYSVHHQDRYLQALIPWMAAGVAATLLLVARTGRIALGAAATLVAFQMIWGGDTWALRSHMMIHDSIIKRAVDIVSSGFRKKPSERTDPFQPWHKIGGTLKKTDVVLLHDEQIHLGLRVRAINDWRGVQAGIGYGSLASPRAVYDLLAGMEVTHLALNRCTGRDSLAADLVFYDFALRYAVNPKPFDSVTLSEMPKSPPTSQPFGGIVALATCREKYPAGLHKLQDLDLLPGDPRPASQWPRPFEPLSSSDPGSQVARADFLVEEGACGIQIPRPVMDGFQRLVTRERLGLWVRKTSP